MADAHLESAGLDHSSKNWSKLPQKFFDHKNRLEYKATNHAQKHGKFTSHKHDSLISPKTLASIHSKFFTGDEE